MLQHTGGFNRWFTIVGEYQKDPYKTLMCWAVRRGVHFQRRVLRIYALRSSGMVWPTYPYSDRWQMSNCSLLLFFKAFSVLIFLMELTEGLLWIDYFILIFFNFSENLISCNKDKIKSLELPQTLEQELCEMLEIHNKLIKFQLGTIIWKTLDLWIDRMWYLRNLEVDCILILWSDDTFGKIKAACSNDKSITYLGLGCFLRRGLRAQ